MAETITVFESLPTTVSGTDVIVKDLEVSGDTITEKTAAITVASGSTVSFQDVSITGVEGTQSSARYSVILNNGVAEFDNLTFTGNYTLSRGTIINDVGSMTITDSVFSDNESSMYSGVIHQYSAAGTINISGSKFTLNRGVNGGAVSSQAAGKVIISKSTFDRNAASTSSLGGGAICIANYRGDFEIYGVSFTGNTTNAAGGAILNTSKLAVGSSEDVISVFSENVSYGSGGAIAANGKIIAAVWYVKDGKLMFGEKEYTSYAAAAKALETAGTKDKIDPAKYTSDDGTVNIDASAKDETQVGAIRYVPELSVHNALFDKNIAQGTHGGAVYSTGATLISGATFSGNTAGNGGAVYLSTADLLAPDGEVKIENSAFYNNAAINEIGSSYGDGGAIYVNNGKLTLQNSYFSGNTANKNSTAAGALSINTGVEVLVNGATFATASDTIYTAGALTLQGDIEFNGNIAKSAAGTITVAENAELTFASAVSVATLTFSSAESNSILFADGVAFTSQDLAGVNLSVDTARVDNAFAVTGVSTMGTLTVNGNTVGADGYKFQNGNKYFDTKLAENGFTVTQYGVNVDALTDNADDGKTGFGEAVAAGYTHIGFADSIFTDGVANITGYSGGDLKGNLTISAGAGKQVVFTGNNDGERFMAVASGSGNSVVLENLTLKEFFCADNGGALNVGGDVSIKGAVFSGNTAGYGGSAKNGGALYIGSGSNVTVENSIFSENVFGAKDQVNCASNGGGAVMIYGNAETTASFIGCTFDNNRTTANTYVDSDGNTSSRGGRGGAIYVGGANATVIFKGSTFLNTTDPGYNCVMYIRDGSELQMSGIKDDEGNVIRKNLFQNNAGGVNGLDFYGSISDTIFRANTAKVAVGISGGTNSRRLLIENVTFDGNAKGALIVADTAQVTVKNTEFLTANDTIAVNGNSGKNQYAALTLQGNIALGANMTKSAYGSISADNACITFVNSASISVGNLDFDRSDEGVSASTLVFKGSTVAFSDQDLSGVAMSFSAADVTGNFAVYGISTMGTLTVDGNAVGENGYKFITGDKCFNTVLTADGFSVTQTGVVVDALTDTADDGKTGFGEALAAAKNGNFSEIIFADSIFTDGVSEITGFSAGKLDSQYNISIDGGADRVVVFSGNGGDARFMEVGSNNLLTLKNVRIEKFYSSLSGGAIFNTGTLDISNAVFSGNTAGKWTKSYGGVIDNKGGNVSVSDSVFENNTFITSTSGSGGNISTREGGSTTVTECIFTGNSYTKYPGQTDNNKGRGSVFFIEGESELNVIGSTFYGNGPAENSNVIYNQTPGRGKINISGTLDALGNKVYTVFDNNIGGVGGLAIDLTLSDTIFRNTEKKQAIHGTENSNKLARVSIDGATFCNNNAGAIYLKGATATISNAKFLTGADTVEMEAATNEGCFTQVTFKNDIELNASVTGAGTKNAESARFTFNNDEAINVAGLTFSGSGNAMTFNGAVVNFTAATELTDDLVISVNSDTDVIAKGTINGLDGRSIKVNGKDAVVNGAGFVAADTDFITLATYKESSFELENIGTLYAGYDQVDNAQYFATLQDIQESYAGFTGATVAKAADGYTAYNLNFAEKASWTFDNSVTIYGTATPSAQQNYAVNVSNGTENVSVTLNDFDHNGDYLNLVCTQAADFNVAINKFQSEKVNSEQRGFIHFGNTQLTGDMTVTVKDSVGTRIYLGGTNHSVGGNISVTLDNTTLTESGGYLTLGASTQAHIATDVTMKLLNGTQIAGSVRAVGEKTSGAISGSVYLEIDNSSVAKDVFGVFGGVDDGKTDNDGSSVAGNVNVLLKTATVGGSIYKEAVAGRVAGDMIVTVDSGESTVASLVGADKLIFKEGATIVFTQSTDLSDVAITVDGTGLEAGAIIATGVAGTLGADDTVTNGKEGLSLAIMNGDLILKQDAELAGSLFVGSNCNYIAGGEITGTLYSTTTYSSAIYTTVSDGTIGQYLLGGLWKKGAVENVVEKAAVTVAGGLVKGSVYAGGYSAGANGSTGVSADALMNVAESALELSGGEVKRDIYGGIHACKYGYGEVGTVNISVSGGVYNNCMGGGWAEQIATSVVGTVNITVSAGEIDMLFAGGGASLRNRENVSIVNTANLTVSGGKVNNIYLSGLNENCEITTSATLAITAANSFEQITGLDCNGKDSTTGTGIVEVRADVSCADMNNIDTLVIGENCKLTLEDVSNIGSVEFDLGDDGFGEWTALAGTDLYEAFADTKFTLGDLKDISLNDLVDNGVAELSNNNTELTIKKAQIA